LLKRSLAAPANGLPNKATRLIKEEMIPVISIGAPLDTRKAGNTGLTMYDAAPLMTLMTSIIINGSVKILSFSLSILKPLSLIL